MTSSVAETGATTTPQPALLALAKQPPWDLLVIGGGTAGIVGAKTAARFGARVLLVDDVRTTGATLAACLEALGTSGAVEVDTLVLASRDRQENSKETTKDDG